MPAIIRTEKTRYIGDQFQAVKGYLMRQSWAAPAAASATSIVNAHAADGSTITSGFTQPDFARTLQYVSSGTDTTHTVTVNGTDIRGAALAETITLNGVTVVHGTKAFLTITSVVLPNVAANNVSVGIDTGLGFYRKMSENGVFIETSDNVQETVSSATVAISATNISGNYIKPVTAPNGTHNYAVWFATNELYAGAN